MSPPQDPLLNPYAPPASELSQAGAAPATQRSSYEKERRSVALMLLLSVVTFGLYPTLWYSRRAPFLDGLSADRKVAALPWVYVAAFVAEIVVVVANAPPAVIRSTELVVGASGLFLAFRVARILRSDFARHGRFIDILDAGVFFFGCLYLQHVINEAAGTPARKSETPASDRDALS